MSVLCWCISARRFCHIPAVLHEEQIREVRDLSHDVKKITRSKKQDVGRYYECGKCVVLHLIAAMCC